MSKSKENVILFPKTIEYYQLQLTRMLENENYQEAYDLLDFLIQCQGDDKQTLEEWVTLHQWLAENMQHNKLDSEEDFTELDLYQEQIKSKAGQDQAYAKKLLDVLLQESSPMDQKMLALDQLTYIEHVQINDILKRWLTNVDLHPLIQFKVLQTLKIRKVTGDVQLSKCGEDIEVEVSHTPLDMTEFPDHILQVKQRVERISEVQHPALGYFAEQTWKDFLHYVYGTSIYDQLLAEDEAGIDTWAAALHFTAVYSMLGQVDQEEILESYGVTQEMVFRFEQACAFIQRFISTAFSGR
jgi:hypothetical protein